jgi:hypothetical protein
MTVAVDGIAGIAPRKCRSAVLHSYGEGNEDAAAIAELFASNLELAGVRARRRNPERSRRTSLGQTFLKMPLSKRMAGSTGLEPAASAVTGQRSNQLNYDPAFADDASWRTPDASLLPFGSRQIPYKFLVS